MRILFASPDRDLLECYRRILEADLGETVTAFDGTQAASLLASERFDAAVLDSEIPRIACGTLAARMRERDLPVVVLTKDPVTVRLLAEEAPANAYLPFPFLPEELESLIRDTLEKAASGERLSVFGREADVSGFRFTDGPYLTGAEIDVLRALLRGERVTDGSGAYVAALNAKFALIGSRAGIRYRTGKGFELVDQDE